MKPYPRIRKTVKWGGAVVSVLLLVVWIGSGWYYMSLGSIPGCSGEVHSGAVYLYVSEPAEGMFFAPSVPSRSTWDEGRPLAYELVWSFQGRRFSWLGGRAFNFTRLRLPLWAPAVLTVLVTVAAWRLDTLARRRAKLGVCPKCAYSRTGLAPTAVCPECGTAPSSNP